MNYLQHTFLKPFKDDLVALDLLRHLLLKDWLKHFDEFGLLSFRLFFNILRDVLPLD